jgi:hypothetical protein
MSYKKFWPMREGDKKNSREVFKCTGCGAVTEPANGHSGEPDKHRCRPGCGCASDDWNPGNASRDYKKNFDRIFPRAPGAGI